MAELQEFQKLVIANAGHIIGLKVGEIVDDFTLTNAIGKRVSLRQYLEKGPVVIKFYRGVWCPICNLDLREVQKHLTSIKKLGASVIAISPQNPDNALTAKEKNALDFEVLSDLNQEVIKAFQLQFDPGADYHSRRDLTKENGDNSKLLPVPATYIIDSSFTIIAAHVEANYTKRMPPQEIIKVLSNI